MQKNDDYETERLLLRATSLEDAEFIFELLNTPKWFQFIGDRNITSIKSAEDYINMHIVPIFSKNGFGNFTVIRKSDGRKIGSCGLYDREGVEGIDLGFAFLPAYEKQGYALESASKVKTLAVSDFNLSQISAITNPDNLGSQKLLNKLDFQFVKRISLPAAAEEILLYKWEL